jgi:hypothetical protein
MEITAAEILKKLPDFSDLVTIADDIAATIVEKLMLDKEIKQEEARIIKEVMTNPVYLIGGKIPSMTLIGSTYAYTGFSGELIPVREKLILATAKLEKLKSRLDLYKEFLSMWRSLNASERAINA